ncbi:MAG: diversity-generating retroelement protein Avd [Spirulina sp. SIO3F2]|nr:diversity-generating retroelement protein Avd [Spirulina sp. SIO3F2]
MSELPIVQKTYDLIRWYVPILNRLPRDHKFALGDRLVSGLYDLLEGLITARYARNKLEQLQPLSAKLDILRYQTRLLFDFQLIDTPRYEYASRLIDELGQQLGGWLEQQRRKQGA